MNETANIGGDSVEERLKKLAREKSYLQLTITMMNKLNARPGLEETIKSIFETIYESIGSSDVSLYYLLENSLYFCNFQNTNTKIEEIIDVNIKLAFKTHRFIEIENEFKETYLTTKEFSKSYTWIYPLMTGDLLIGIIKIENLMIPSSDFKGIIITFFNYVAYVLKNQIDYRKLENAHHQLEIEVNNRIET